MLALALAPLTVPLALAGFWAATGAKSEQLPILAIAALYTYAVAVVVGLPAAFILRYFGRTHAWQYALAGLLTGALAFLFLFKSGGWALALFGALGVVAALLFWLVGVRGNAVFARPPGSTEAIARSLVHAGGEVRRTTIDVRERLRTLLADLCATIAAWRSRPRGTPGPPRAPVAGIIAVAIPLLTTVGTFPWIWLGLRRSVERLYTAGMIVVLGYWGIVVALSAITVIIALVAILLRERYRYPLALAAVALAAAGLAILRVQFG